MAPVTVATVNAGLAPPGTCPLCHAVGSITAAALAAGGGWRCAVCDQRWDAARLDSVARYAQFVADRAADDRARR